MKKKSMNNRISLREVKSQVIHSLINFIQNQQQDPAAPPHPLYENAAVDAVKVGINASLQQLLNEQNFALPATWTFPQFTQELFGDLETLDESFSIFRE